MNSMSNAQEYDIKRINVLPVGQISLFDIGSDRFVQNISETIGGDLFIQIRDVTENRRV